MYRTIATYRYKKKGYEKNLRNLEFHQISEQTRAKNEMKQHDEMEKKRRSDINELYTRRYDTYIGYVINS